MIGIQPIDQYARDISDEKQASVIDGSSKGTDKRYTVLHQDYTDPDALRKLAASIKDHTLHHLEDYLAKAEKSLTKNGVNVHFAATDPLHPSLPRSHPAHQVQVHGC
jgi:L-lactate dehydrogenase complex protein LldF